jgi:glycogen phosphorylase
VLGIGGATILRALGFAIDTYHLNEGHAALLTLRLLREYRREPDPLPAGNPLYEREHVRDRCVFTTHTRVDAAFDKFPYDLVRDILGDYIEISELKLLAGDSQLNMTQLALNLSGFVNGVSRQHAETTTQLFPGYRVHSITNGVHPPTWTHASFARLYDADFPQWAHEPEVLKDADQLRDADIWSAHQEAKRSLADYIRAQAGFFLRDDVALIGFARRMTGYKCPDLLFDDIAALSKVARERPFQVVFAGIAHPRDVHGTQLIAQINQQIRNLKPVVPMAFLPNYDMRVGALLTAGADVWLNTRLPPLEASGTSGMKAALNGVLNLSVLDGWWVEAHIEGVTGWAIGNGKNSSGHQDAAELYAKLSRTILPLYYDDRDRWIWMMKQSISKVGAYFTTQRVMRRYATEAYLR